MKLYPPKIEEKIPALIWDNEEALLRIPFQLNPAVSLNQISGLSLILKTVQTNFIKINGKQSSNFYYNEDVDCYYVNFTIDNSDEIQKVNISQYYKIQIAFIDNSNEVGYYSSIGIVKCTSRPTVIIQDMKADEINKYKHSYTGVYQQTPYDALGNTGEKINRDYTEKVYQYRFIIKNFQTGEIFDDSGLQLHNATQDSKNDESSDTWETSKVLNNNVLYVIQYIVYTMNNLTIESSFYQIMNVDTVDLDLNASLKAIYYEDDAYVKLILEPKEHITKKIRLSGNFIVTRMSSEDNFTAQYVIHSFSLLNEIPKKEILKDFTIKQGCIYKYFLKSYNEKFLYSNPLESIYYMTEDTYNRNLPVKEFMLDFEHAYLYDGERQLKIEYNPKVTSFKRTILESKLDTLGGKYPFIFRNGNVLYHEFPISGLISKLSDPNNLFYLKSEEIKKVRQYTPDPGYSENISSDNFKEERDFKMEVLQWLTNGKPKLFRSPGEGNFIVRLMNSSLTPNDTLSRMIHTFNCTAYEIAECNFKNLQDFNFIEVQSDLLKKEFKIGTKYIRELFIKKGTEYSFGEQKGLYYLAFDNQWTDLTIQIMFADGTSSVVTFNTGNQTGHYQLPKYVLEKNPIIAMTWIDGIIEVDSTITLGYFDESLIQTYSLVSDVTIKDIVYQFIGPGYGINLIKNFENFKTKVLDYYSLKIEPRRIITIFKKNGTYYHDKTFNVEVLYWDRTAIYRVKENSSEIYYNGVPFEEGVFNEEQKRIETLDYKISINDNVYNDLHTLPIVYSDFKKGPDYLKNEGKYPFTGGRIDLSGEKFGNIKNINVGNALICNLVCHVKQYEYKIETEPYINGYPTLKNLQDNCKKYLLEYQNYFANGQDILAKTKLVQFEQEYDLYLKELERAYNIEKQKGDSLNAI